MKIVLDTKVFLDYLLSRENANKVKEILFLCRYGKHQIYTTPIALRDIGYVIHKITHNKADSKRAQLAVCEMVNDILPVTGSDASNSLRSEIDDYEDALMVECAKREKMDAIITSNIKDFLKADMPIYTLDEANKFILENTKKA